jgi:hypothetical protein
MTILYGLTTISKDGSTSVLRAVFDSIDEAKKQLFENPIWLEERYYRYAVIESFPLNCIDSVYHTPTSIWFKFSVMENDDHEGSVRVLEVECPEDFKNSRGFGVP